MNKTHVKRTLRILLTCFLLLVFISVLAFFIYLLNYQIKYNWLDPVNAIAHDLYNRDYRPDKSLMNFPVVFYNNK